MFKGVIHLNKLRKESSGFSLVELLITIAVIGILASIMFPVFNRSKAQSRKATCSSNLKQLGAAFHQYLTDWNGVYPSPGGLMGDWGYWSQSGNGGLVSYVGEPGGVDTIWCCPELGDWTGYYPARTYSMNSYLRGYPDRDYPGSIYDKTGCPEVFIEEPRRTILLFEGITISLKKMDTEYDYIYRCGNWTCVRGWRTEKLHLQHSLKSWLPWHGRLNNYLYCDGHIRAFEPVKYKPGVNYPPYDIKYEWWVRKSVMGQK